jgi:apolipoprotein N-acyltransferase
MEFHGVYILGVYLLLAFLLGLQFGLLSLLILNTVYWGGFRIAAIAGAWTLFEWGRFHLLCGFSWNMVGISLASFPIGMQLAGVFGALGLSFWVIFTNLLGFRAIRWGFAPPSVALWGMMAIFPYLYGVAVVSFHSPRIAEERKIRALLVQPGLLPSEKSRLAGRHADFVSPWEQWRAIFEVLLRSPNRTLDFIALPESALPFRVDEAVFDYDLARDLLIETFGREALNCFPSLTSPFVEKGKVSNAFFSQFLANCFQTDFVIGLDQREGDRYYTAAHHFSPWVEKLSRYDKRILVPLAEYIPFTWCSALSKLYGITSFYTPGEEAKIFPSPLRLSASICYEETFPETMREGRMKGALAFVNLTNDNWYPESRLPAQHFAHGRLRAVENGVPLFRACNSGITTGVDALGRIWGQLDGGKGALFVAVPNYQIQTIYTLFGDSLIIGCCFGFLFFYLLINRIFPSVELRLLAPQYHLDSSACSKRRVLDNLSFD